MKKLLYLALSLFLLSSCSIAHKLTTRTHAETDSTSGHRLDSTSTHNFTDSSDYIYLDSSTITVELDTASKPVKDTTVFKQKDIGVLHQVIKAAAGGQKVKSVTIHIGHFSDSSKVIHRIDSVKVIRSDTATVYRNVTTTVKQVSRTSYVIFGIAVFLIIAIIIVIKFKIL